MGAKQRFPRWPLKKAAGLGVDRRAQKIVCGGVADIDLDRGIEPDQIDQIGFEECPVLEWRLRLERICAQFLHRTQRRDAETDLLREPELQQNKKETTKTKMAFSQEIHRLHSQLELSCCTRRAWSGLCFWPTLARGLSPVQIANLAIFDYHRL